MDKPKLESTDPYKDLNWIDCTHQASLYEEQFLGLREPGDPRPPAEYRYRPFEGGDWIYGTPSTD